MRDRESTSKITRIDYQVKPLVTWVMVTLERQFYYYISLCDQEIHSFATNKEIHTHTYIILPQAVYLVDLYTDK